MLESLPSLLSNVFICRDKADARILKLCPLGVFSTRSFSRSLEENPEAKSRAGLGFGSSKSRGILVIYDDMLGAYNR